MIETMTTRFSRQRLTALPIQRPTRDAQGVPVTAVAAGWSNYGGEICPWWAVFPYAQYRGNPDYVSGYTPWLLAIVAVDGIVLNEDKWKARRAFPN